MKIAFLNYFDLQNPDSWPRSEFGFISTNYHKAKSLESFAEVEYVCALEYPLSARRSRLVEFKRRIYRKLDRRYIHWATPHLSRTLARQIAPRLKGVDLVVGSDTTLIAQLDIPQPIVLWATNLFDPLIGRYGDYSGLCFESRYGLRWFDRQSVRRCRQLVFPSQWAADNAIQKFNFSRDRVSVVPYGANNAADRTEEEIERDILNRPTDPLKLLFIGVDWARKGGEIVLEVVRRLQDRGVKTELTIVGVQLPQNKTLPPNTRSLGFLDRFTPDGKARLQQCLRESHALLLPSEAETYGNVLCEANSFGLPVFASRVGGMPTIVRDGENGYSFSRADFAAECSRILEPLATDSDTYRQLARGALRTYRSRLSWDAASQQMQRLCRSALGAGSAPDDRRLRQ
ncbi:MAG: glycosyltransferase family 4 protein [Geitlerinemataceae cyanobacterium]